MAFRMGQDLGFQQDPAQWVSKDETIVTEVDLEIRRRLYWGCYVSDKYIKLRDNHENGDPDLSTRLMSLYLGRPVYLNESDAAVDPTEPLPYVSSLYGKGTTDNRPPETFRLPTTGLVSKISPYRRRHLGQSRNHSCPPPSDTSQLSRKSSKTSCQVSFLLEDIRGRNRIC